MGKTKRVSEMLVQAYADKVNDIKLSIVRFGNVLDSSGSVIPLFKSQIETRSPLTITHPDVTRYFMLIPEAVNLIMQTLYIAKGGEVFVLDMGKPIKIMDLAKQMIRLSNLSVKENSGNGDIEIKIIGLREGEKLHEELMIDNEYKLSENKKIFIAHEKYISLDKLEEKLVLLSKCAEENNEIASKRIMDEIVKF
jgi:FlaA1/EpsC-like NDP-sugar epimerase